MVSLIESPTAPRMGSPHRGLTRSPPSVVWEKCELILFDYSRIQPAKQAIIADTQLARGWTLEVVSKLNRFCSWTINTVLAVTCLQDLLCLLVCTGWSGRCQRHDGNLRGDVWEYLQHCPCCWCLLSTNILDPVQIVCCRSGHRVIIFSWSFAGDFRTAAKM